VHLWVISCEKSSVIGHESLQKRIWSYAPGVTQNRYVGANVRAAESEFEHILGYVYTTHPKKKRG